MDACIWLFDFGFDMMKFISFLCCVEFVFQVHNAYNLIDLSICLVCFVGARVLVSLWSAVASLMVLVCCVSLVSHEVLWNIVLIL